MGIAKAITAAQGRATTTDMDRTTAVAAVTRDMGMGHTVTGTALAVLTSIRPMVDITTAMAEPTTTVTGTRDIMVSPTLPHIGPLELEFTPRKVVGGNSPL